MNLPGADPEIKIVLTNRLRAGVLRTCSRFLEIGSTGRFIRLLLQPCVGGDPVDLPSLATILRERLFKAVYVGTFSRTVFPALRIGYLIVPKSLAAAFTGAKWLNDLHSATLEQQTLAEFITTGMYDRHLGRLRRRNTARRGALLEAIHKYLGTRVEVTGDGSGTHIVLWPTKSVLEEALVAHAALRGVGISGISHCFITRPSRPGIILGYSRMNEREIREGIRRLSETL